MGKGLTGKYLPAHNVQFKDGNPLNCEIENLYLISRKDQMKKRKRPFM